MAKTNDTACVRTNHTNDNTNATPDPKSPQEPVGDPLLDILNGRREIVPGEKIDRGSGEVYLKVVDGVLQWVRDKPEDR